MRLRIRRSPEALREVSDDLGCASATLPSDKSCFCFPVGYGYVLRWSGTAHKRQGLTEGSQLRECQSSLASVG